MKSTRTAILLGSKPGSVAALLWLKKLGWDVRGVVTSGSTDNYLQEPDLGDVAFGLGIPVHKTQESLNSEPVELVISYMYRNLVKTNTRALGKFAINFHAGPLPEFGGWAFYNQAILEEAPEYGCTCHIMDDAFDTGPIVRVRRFFIDASVETALSLERKAQSEMILLFAEIIALYESTGDLPTMTQDPSRQRYMKQAEFENGKRIPANSTKAEADRIARAFWYPPYSMAHLELPNGDSVEVIPEGVKSELATLLHAQDLRRLIGVLGMENELKASGVLGIDGAE